MWLYQNQPVEEIDPKYTAFVYLITNLVNGKQYIGLKLTKFAKTKQVKGKKKRYKVESDWREYWSSSEELKQEVEKLGEESFKREILYFCLNKGTANYLEAREQFDRRVLEHPDKWYNSIVNCRVHRNHIRSLISP
jgi:hypothetical protein